ncbi:hypothetical protein [Membranihabitans maritimus]|uniref:hypothetical protein n=1 Tax=Membranihabitans maritimus TaxID=2904244 RepID=UPI001F409BC0|nr:hypothetical protein [Membranihabitans maritimus]
MSINLVEIFDDQKKLDEKSREFLLKAIEKNNKPGFDYLEFKQAMIRLNKLKIEESIAIESAFATASTVGLNKDSLIKSAEYYLSILKNEFNQFNTALEKQIESKIHSKKKQKATLEEKIKSIQKEIENLHKNLKQHENKLSKLDQDTAEAQKKIEDTSERFKEALSTITNRIEKDIELFENNID